MSTTKTKSQNASARKRILSVTIRRMVDDSPDTSWLGEYGKSPKTEYAIDRAHSEDCMENDTTQKEKLESIADAIESDRPVCEDHTQQFDCDCDICQEERAYTEAMETIRELATCDCGEHGDMGRGQYRYFNGPVENYKGLEPAEIRKYIRQDYDRMESLNRGDWCYIGIRAEAQIQTGSDVVQKITSGGLYGVESDSGREHIEETIREELANLKTELLALGFSKRAIASAFKNIREENE